MAALRRSHAPTPSRARPVPHARARPTGVHDVEAIDRVNEAMLERLQREGGLFLSRNRLRGRVTLRACITHLRTREEHVRRFFDACVDAAREHGSAKSR